MSENEYPVLKLKYDNVFPHATEISLDGVPLKYVRGVMFSAHIDNDVNIVQLELIAKVDIESPVNATTDLITFIADILPNAKAVGVLRFG